MAQEGECELVRICDMGEAEVREAYAQCDLGSAYVPPVRMQRLFLLLREGLREGGSPWMRARFRGAGSCYPFDRHPETALGEILAARQCGVLTVRRRSVSK